MNRIVETINAMNRRVTLKRSPSFGAQLFRKRILRTAPTSVGGIPTLGGLTVLDSVDEENITFDYLGNARVVRVNEFAPSMLNDRMDTHNSGGTGNELRFIIEPETANGATGFEPKNHDVMFLWILADGSVRVAYEIVGVESVNNLPPFSVRYLCNRRADLDIGLTINAPSP